MKERKQQEQPRRKRHNVRKKMVDVWMCGCGWSGGSYAARPATAQITQQSSCNCLQDAPLRFRDTFWDALLETDPGVLFVGYFYFMERGWGVTWRGQPEYGSPFAASPPLRLELVITFRLWCCQLHHLCCACVKTQESSGWARGFGGGWGTVTLIWFRRVGSGATDFAEGGKVFLVMAEPASDAQPMAVNDEQGAGAAALDFVPPPKPQFGALSAHEMNGGKFEFRKIFVPQHRFTPLKEHWMEIYTPVFEQMKIDIRMNLKVWPCFRVLGF